MWILPKYVAAIDNGLAFPFKHPDSWRACKYIDLKKCFSMMSSLYKKFLNYKDTKVHVSHVGHKALQELSTGVHACLHYYVVFEDDLNCGNTNLNEDVIVAVVIAI